MSKLRTGMFVITGLGVLWFLAGCSGSKEEPAKAAPIEKPEPASTAAAPDANAEGVALAEEILGVFDKAVAETAELVKDKSAGPELQPKLDALFTKYKSRMTELNVKYLALRDKNISTFGAANGFLGENRGKRVFAKDNLLGPAIAHYNFLKPDKGVFDFLANKITTLMDIAVRN